MTTDDLKKDVVRRLLTYGITTDDLKKDVLDGCLPSIHIFFEISQERGSTYSGICLMLIDPIFLL